MLRAIMSKGWNTGMVASLSQSACLLHCLWKVTMMVSLGNGVEGMAAFTDIVLSPLLLHLFYWKWCWASQGKNFYSFPHFDKSVWCLHHPVGWPLPSFSWRRQVQVTLSQKWYERFDIQGPGQSFRVHASHLPQLTQRPRWFFPAKLFLLKKNPLNMQAKCAWSFWKRSLCLMACSKSPIQGLWWHRQPIWVDTSPSGIEGARLNKRSNLQWRKHEKRNQTELCRVFICIGD